MARVKFTNRFVEKKTPPSQGQKQADYWDADTPGLGLRIGHGGRRTFHIIVRINGKQRRYNLGIYPEMTLKEAREAAIRVRGDARKGIDPKEREQEERRTAERARAHTFGSVAAEFIEGHAKRVAPKSWGTLERRISRSLSEWSELPISSITRSDVRQLFNNKARNSPIEANRILTLIKQIFEWAIDEEILDVSPARRITPEEEPSRDRVLTDDEIEAVWQAFVAEGYPFGPLFQLLLITGQRRSEVAGIRRSEIRGDEWHLPSSRSKSGRVHLVPLSPMAIELLGQLPNTGDCYFSSGHVGDNPVNGLSVAKKRCEKRCRVEDWRLHDLRRTVATNMRRLRVDRLTVSKVLNHAEGGVTQIYDRYAADPEKREALERWATHLKGLVSGEIGADVVDLRGKN
jgi:integrase